MAKKLIISESQLNLITQHIGKSDVVIEEGFKEIALGLLLLAGVTLSGQNKAIAQDALNNPVIVQKIDNVLADTASLEKVVDRIDKKMPDAGQKILDNAANIKATINYIDDKNTDDDPDNDVTQYTKTVRTGSPSQMRSMLKQGYAVTGVDIQMDTILPPKSIVVIQDTIDFNWSSDNFFESGGFDLNASATDSIGQVVNDIKINGGRIIGVYIESSTDKEPIRMGNEQLAQNRVTSVEEYMMLLGLDGAQFNTETKPNSGPDVYTNGMSKDEKLNARIKTAPYRYVKVRLVVVFEEEVKQGETAPQVMERHIYELTKVTTGTSNTVKIKYQTGRKTKCKKVIIDKGDGETIPHDCTFLPTK